MVFLFEVPNGSFPFLSSTGNLKRATYPHFYKDIQGVCEINRLPGRYNYACNRLKYNKPLTPSEF